MAREHFRSGQAAGSVLRLVAALTLAAATFVTPPWPAGAAITAQQYRLIDLGSFGTYTRAEASGVSSGGFVVGTYSDSIGSTAFSYFRGSKTILSAPDEFMFTHAVGISAPNRRIAGYACAAEDHCRVVQWSGSSTLDNYGTLPGGTEAYPTAINSGGKMVGWGAVGGPLEHAFVTYGDPYFSIVDLNHYTGTSGWTLERALDINEAGAIVGAASVSGETRGFLLKSPYSSANLVDLGYRTPFLINDAGHIVARDHGMDAEVWFDGSAYHTIPALPDFSEVNSAGLNNRDEVVGIAYSAVGQRPILYRNGTTYDLRTLLAPTPWTLEAATAINDSGEIAGTATRNGVTHPVLLVPTWPVASTYSPVAPTRVLDTRINLGLSGSFVAGVARKLTIPKTVIPPEATSITANLTITGATAGGWVAAGPTVSAGSTSVLNARAKEVRANGITVQLAPDGTLMLLYGPASTARAHLVLDITGYFAPDDGGYRYTTMTPTRMYDSRTPTHNPVQVGTPRLIPIRGNAAYPVPSNVVAVTGNLTITQPSAGGWVALGPTPSPKTSTINFTAGETTANNVTVTLTPAGGLYAVFGGSATGSRVDVVFDLTGYFTSGTGLRFTPVAPTRVVDTRIGKGISSKLVCGGVRGVGLATATVPFAAQTVVGNATIVTPSSRGYLVLGPTVAVPAKTSTLNYAAGDIRANGATFRLGHNASQSTFPAVLGGCPTGATSHFVFDVMGYYR